MSIITSTIDTPLGSMIVGIAEDHCVFLDFEDRRSINKLIQQRVSHWGSLQQGHHPLIDTIKLQLDEYFSGKRQTFTIPYLLLGSSFNQKVWKALTEIPHGQTASYGELANQIGLPISSARAVGRANGQNCLAIIIPCHRVIGADGSLVGYGGGIPRKQALINLENQQNTQTNLDHFFSTIEDDVK